MDEFLRVVGFVTCIVLSVLAVGNLIAHALEGERPRLVGTGCVGTSGPIYANEEDHFPLCKRIDPVL